MNIRYSEFVKRNYRKNRTIVSRDIASMKIVAISQRGKKRDFIDLYWLISVNGFSLYDVIKHSVSQYPEQEHSLPHFIKSLTYFADAEEDPMPKLHFKADWDEIKVYFRRVVPGVAKEILELE